MKHTPSYWRLDLGKTSNDIWHDGELIALIFKGEDIETADANARLMASAPEMLKALQFALERLEEVRLEQRYDHKTFDWDGNDIAIDMARAAIAKATGEQS
jgi:hypothetical protein